MSTRSKSVPVPAGGRRGDGAARRAAAAGGGQREDRGGAPRAAGRALQPGQEGGGLHLPQARLRAPPWRPLLLLLRLRRKRSPPYPSPSSARPGPPDPARGSAVVRDRVGWGAKCGWKVG